MTKTQRWENVPICDLCWEREEMGRQAVRMRKPVAERCYACNEITRSGIYVRRQVG